MSSSNRELAGGKVVLDRPAEAVARLTIRNAAKRNALDHEILDAIAAAMPELDDGIETRCVLIAGSEGMFSAGYDIGGIPDEVFAEEAERLVAHPFSRAIEAVEGFPSPTVAVINGHALGGGLELALADRLPLFDGDLLDRAGVLGLDRHLHLHRLEDDDGVVEIDLVADGDLDLPDRSGDVGRDVRHRAAE